MLLVKTYLDKSKIHGLGLFAGEFIAKGTVVWKFVDGFDRLLGQGFVERLPAVAREHIQHYWALLDSGYRLQTSDNAYFFNHDDFPNCETKIGVSDCVAARNIPKGEELTENYRYFWEKSFLCG